MVTLLDRCCSTACVMGAIVCVLVHVGVLLVIRQQSYIAPVNASVLLLHEVHPSDPPVYRLRDDLGEVLEGTFYELELQKVSVPVDKVYRVQEVLQRRTVGRRKETLVKWFGYSSNFNSWIDARALVHSTIKTSRAHGDTAFEK